MEKEYLKVELDSQEKKLDSTVVEQYLEGKGVNQERIQKILSMESIKLNSTTKTVYEKQRDKKFGVWNVYIPFSTQENLYQIILELWKLA